MILIVICISFMACLNYSEIRLLKHKRMGKIDKEKE